MKSFATVVFALSLCANFVLGQGGSVGTEEDRSAIEKAATQFVESYNARNVDALSALFADNAEVVRRDGTRVVGREAISLDLAEAFEQNPQAKISLDVESLKFVSDSVATESGRTEWFPDGKTLTSESTYRVVHVKRDGKWRIAGVQTLDSEVVSNFEYLRDLEWLVGDWIDEGSDAIVETSFRWSENRAFLIRKFTVKTRGSAVIEGTQRIGWDPTRKQFRSWTFDTEGSFVEGFWTQVDGGYVIRSAGYLKDGSSVSGTTRVDRESDERIGWSMFNRLRGQEIIPDIDVTIVRKPPAPGGAQK